jgi:hypothetical protein
VQELGSWGGSQSKLVRDERDLHAQLTKKTLLLQIINPQPLLTVAGDNPVTGSGWVGDEALEQLEKHHVIMLSDS